MRNGNCRIDGFHGCVCSLCRADIQRIHEDNHIESVIPHTLAINYE